MKIDHRDFSNSWAIDPMSSPTEILLQAKAAVMRHRVLIAGTTAVFLALAVVYLLLTPKQYLATAEMVIDPRKSTEYQQQGSGGLVTPVDSAVVESQGEILKSENVAKAVIKTFDLVNDPAFNEPSGPIGLIKSALQLVLPASAPTDYERERRTIEAFQDRLYVKRVGVTYVFEISFLSPDPEQAAKIANAVAEAYVSDDLEAKYSARRRAAAWMQDRIKELGKQATEAEQAVVAFKSKHNIVNTGGRLLDEQQIAEITSQLSLARAATNEAKAKLDRIGQVTSGSKLDLSVADALHNEVIVKLRDTYLDMTKREADLTSRLGRDHEAPRRLRADMQNVRASIFDELKRIGEGYRSDYQIAQARAEGLTNDLARTVERSNETNSAQVHARELESNAQSLRAVYDSFLQRYAESVQQQSFPLTETRVVTSASPPLKKSQPKSLLTLLGALIAGSCLGFGIGWMRDITDSSLRTGAQAEEAADVLHLASIPKVAGRPNPQEMLAEVVNRPLSGFAESIRELRMIVEARRTEQNLKTIGFTSAVPGEGKSTIAANLARLMARARGRVLLIDGDLRNPSLSRALVPGATRGLLEVLLGEVDPDEVTQTDAATGLRIMPAPNGRDRSDISDLLSSMTMAGLMESLKSRYDVIVIDLPPVLSVIDAKAAAGLFDGCIFVAQWGATPSEAVTEAVQGAGRLRERLIGIVLNMVDVRSMGRHRGQGYGQYRRAHALQRVA